MLLLMIVSRTVRSIRQDIQTTVLTWGQDGIMSVQNIKVQMMFSFT